MKTIVLVTGIFVLCCALNEVFCLTNFEFYELVKPYADDIEVFDLDDPTGDFKTDDVITLPGNHDADVDWAHIISKLDLERSVEQKLRCLNIAFLPQLKGFKVSLSANGRTLYSKEMSLKKGITICRGVPKLKVIRADICLVFYNINLAKKRICAKLTGNLDLKIKSFGVSLPLACPIPLPFAGENDESLTANSSLIVHDGVDEDQQQFALTDLPTMFKELQILLEDKHVRDIVNEEMNNMLDSTEYPNYGDQYEESQSYAYDEYSPYAYDEYSPYAYDEDDENFEYGY